MRKALFLFTVFLIMLGCCSGQTNISIQFNTSREYKTVMIQGYQADTGYYTLTTLPYSKTLAFKNKTPLEPGLYFILCDSSMTGAFILSSSKNQNFNVTIGEQEIKFSGNHENEQYALYLKQMHDFEQQMEALNREYQDAQRSMPQYMLKTLVDSLNVKAKRIQKAQKEYQAQMAATNKGTLLASIIQTSTEIQTPPEDIINNRYKMMEYYTMHYFDNFPWEDPRIFNTPLGDNKTKEFQSLLLQQRNHPILDSAILSAFRASKANPTSHRIFFEKLEKVFGDHASPYRIERVYITMLKDMLATKGISELDKRHYTYELNAIDKNNEGERANNFRIVTSTGDTTTLYDIQSEYLLLYLQHPTCPTCQRVRKMIADFPFLNKAIASGKMKVLTVYFEDETEVWNNYIHSPEANPNYLHGWNFDQSISDNALYDTRAIPYMFILDKNKRILRKNVMENDLEDQIKQLHILN
jgi:thioredoxin-related protein